MNHSIKSKQNIDIHNLVVKVELLPANDIEKNAIRNLQTLNASDTEKELVGNYLHFNLGLGDYSVLQSLNQTGNIFTLNIFI